MVFHFSPFPAFRPFSIPYRPDRIPTVVVALRLEADFHSCLKISISEGDLEFCNLLALSMENKKPIKKKHIKEFGGGNAPGASRG